MSYAIRKGSMREHINTIFMTLISDEILMRLLVYPPENYAKNIPNPLDRSLPDIVDKDSREYWKLVNHHVITATKTQDILENEEICRLYLYPGRRKPVRDYLLAEQEIVIDVLVHENFNIKDLRMLAINDRISDLLTLKRITGFGRVDYFGGSPRQGARGYDKFENIYIVNTSK